MVVIQYRVPSTLTLTKISKGGIGGFAFTGNNGWQSQTITTQTSGIGINGAMQALAAPEVETTITEAAPPGYRLTSAACTGMGPGGTATLSGNTLTFNPAAVSAGTNLICTLTSVKIPTVKVVRKTFGGFGGPFSFTATNLSRNPSAITTTAADTFTPPTPEAIEVVDMRTPVTISETIPNGFFPTASTCFDANSAFTRNTVPFNTLIGNTLTIDVGFLVPGATLVCQFTNTKMVPGLSITQTYAPAGPFRVGQRLTYTYTIENTGTVPMTNVQVLDMRGAPAQPVPLGADGINKENVFTYGSISSWVNTTDTTPNDGVWSKLAPGAAVRFNYLHVVTQAEIDHG